MIDADKFERVTVNSRAALFAWLDEHHAQADAVWVVTWKKSVPEKYVSTHDILDAVVAYGWVDGIRRKVEPLAQADGTLEERTMQLISPRRVQHWAQSYKERAARLEAEGIMHDAGRAARGGRQFSGPPELSQTLHPPLDQARKNGQDASQAHRYDRRAKRSRHLRAGRSDDLRGAGAAVQVRPMLGSKYLRSRQRLGRRRQRTDAVARARRQRSAQPSSLCRLARAVPTARSSSCLAALPLRCWLPHHRSRKRTSYLVLTLSVR